MNNFFKGLISRSKVEGDSNLVLQNVQSVHLGLSLQDARQIALEVFNENFFRVTAEAKKIAQERITEFTNHLLNEIAAINPEGVNSFTDPGLQSSLFQAQKDVARTGDKDIAALLIDLIVMRTFHNKRSLEQIVIDEAINVSGKITRNQMVLLSLLFATRAPIRGFKNQKEIIQFFDVFITTVMKGFNMSKPDAYNEFSHLTYTGCVSTGSIGSDFSVHLSHNYDLAFSYEYDGKTFRQIVNKFIPDSKAAIDSPLAESTFTNTDELKDACEQLKVASPFIKFMLDTIREGSKGLESTGEAVKNAPLSSIAQFYKLYGLSGYNLTSVGVPIAKSYIRQVSGINIE